MLYCELTYWMLTIRGGFVIQYLLYFVETLSFYISLKDISIICEEIKLKFIRALTMSLTYNKKKATRQGQWKVKNKRKSPRSNRKFYIKVIILQIITWRGFELA